MMSPEYLQRNNMNIQNYISNQRPRTSMQRNQRNIYTNGSINSNTLHSNAALKKLVATTKNSDVVFNKKPSPVQTRNQNFVKVQKEQFESRPTSQFQAHKLDRKRGTTPNMMQVQNGQLTHNQFAGMMYQRNSIQSLNTTQNSHYQNNTSQKRSVLRNQDYAHHSTGNVDSAFYTSIKESEAKLDSMYNTKRKKILKKDMREKLSQSMVQAPDKDSLAQQLGEENLTDKALHILYQ